MKIGFNAPAPAAAYSVRTVQSERRIMQFMFFLSLFSVRPQKPVIRLVDNSGAGEEEVEGYLGPFLIGTQLSLVCQVNGGKCVVYIRLFFSSAFVRKNPV